MKEITEDILANLIPNGVFSQYIPRVFDNMGGRTDLSLLENAFNNKENVLITGETGVGKTMSVQAFAEDKKLPYYSVNCNRATSTQEMFGQFIPDEDGKSKSGIKWVDGVITQLTRAGGVLLLDEVNMLTANIAAALHPLLDRRRELTLMQKGGEVIVAHKNFFVVATMNPDEYEGTNPLNPAFRNRFATPLRYEYDNNNEDTLLKGLPNLVALGDMLRSAKSNGTILTPVSTNSLIEFADHCEDLDIYTAVGLFLNRFDEDEVNAVNEILGLMLPKIAEDFGIDDVDYIIADIDDEDTEDDTDE